MTENYVITTVKTFKNITTFKNNDKFLNRCTSEKCTKTTTRCTKTTLYDKINNKKLRTMVSKLSKLAKNYQNGVITS